MEDLLRMSVTKGPIIIAVVHQLLDAAWRIRIMRGSTSAGSMQQTYVEQPLEGWRVVLRYVFGDISLIEAATVDSDTYALK